MCAKAANMFDITGKRIAITGGAGVLCGEATRERLERLAAATDWSAADAGEVEDLETIV